MSYVALITGASSGIGEVTTRRLFERAPDAEIVLVARRRDRLDALAQELNGSERGAPPRVYAYAADLTDTEAVAGLATYMTDRFGRLDLLVNNAGARWSSPFADGGYANVAETMAINFDAPVRLTEALLPLLRAAAAPPERLPGAAVSQDSSTATGRGPAIVNVGSTAGRVARSGTNAYSASKFALIGWNDAIHVELKAEGIHVGLVNPGFIVTEGFPQKEIAEHPLRRHMLGTAEQVADAILDAGLKGKSEIYVPSFYWLFAALRIVAPGVLRRAVSGGAFTPKTAQDD